VSIKSLSVTFVASVKIEVTCSSTVSLVSSKRVASLMIRWFAAPFKAFRSSNGNLSKIALASSLVAKIKDWLTLS
jgi:hypothetical protein